MRRRSLNLAALLSSDAGPTLTPYDIARISQESEAPISDETVRRDIERGALQGVKQPRGTLFEWRVGFTDAKRYLAYRCGQGHTSATCSTRNNAAITAIADAV